MKTNWKRNSLVYIILLMMIAVLIFSLRPGTTQPEAVPLGQIIQMSKNGELEKVVVKDEELVVTTYGGKEIKTALGNLTFADLVDREKGFGFVIPPGGFEIESTSGLNWGNI